MRLGDCGLMGLLLVAVPSVSFAQVVVPCVRGDVTTTANVPVAVVTRANDAIAVADARPYDTFILGTATLDKRDTACTKVAFTMRNATDQPIPLTNVDLHGVRVNRRQTDGHLSTACSIGVGPIDRRFTRDTTLQPGATVTVEVPIARECPLLGDTVGFLVSIRSDGTTWVGDGRPVWPGPDPRTVQENALLQAAFGALITPK